MPDFGQFKKHNVNTNAIVEYKMDQLEGVPILHLVPATEANKPYFNALLRKARTSTRALKSKKIDAGTVQENRAADRTLFCEHVIKGWDNVIDSMDCEVEFNKENLTDFLNAIPDWVFDDVRDFAANPLNFTDEMIDAEETAKN